MYSEKLVRIVQVFCIARTPEKSGYCEPERCEGLFIMSRKSEVGSRALTEIGA